MIAGWAAEGVGTGRVARLKGKLPGLYVIQTDEFGDRRFFHWRDSAAARSLMDLPETGDILDSLGTYEVVYLSAITLSIYHPQGRTRLFEALRRARQRGARVAFDTNFRARGWPDPDVARARLRRSIRRIRYCSGVDGGSAAALSRRKRRAADGAHSLRRGRAESSAARKHRAVRWRFAQGEGGACDTAGRRYHGGRGQFRCGLHRRPAWRARGRSKPRRRGIVLAASW